MKTQYIRIAVLNLIILIATMPTGNAKLEEKYPIFLTKYTFSKDDFKVAQVLFPSKDEEIKRIRISGTDASYFKIDKENFIWVKPDKNKALYQIILEVKDKKGKIHSQYFTIIKDEFIKNKVIAHRGAWKNTKVPENSIAALQKAIDLGCQGSEFDVQLSYDSVFFVNHDPDYKGKIIDRTMSSDLSEIKLENGESLPLLKEYLQTGMKQNKTKLILEIKPTNHSKQRVDLLARKAIELVTENQAQAWVEYISFDFELCKALLKYDPFCKVAYLNGDKSPKELHDAGLYGLDYHHRVFKKNPDWIKQSLDLGLTVNTWTVNDKETMQWFLDRDVSFITTNEPELLLEMINKNL